MTAHTFQFELVSPEKLIVSKMVALVTVPGGEGDYGVLPGHAPMITTIKAGVIDIFMDENVPASERIFVGQGFAEVTPTRCTILATDAVPLSHLNRTKLDEELRVLTEKLSATSEAERATLLAQHAIVSAKLQAVA